MRSSIPTSVLVLGLCGACTGVFVAAGPTGDVGTLGVSGLEGGIGGHLEVGVLRERDRSALGGALTSTLAGYTTAGDADPVLLTALEVRSRRRLGAGPHPRSRRPFFEAGGGPGVMWSAGPRAGGLVGHVAAGIESGGPGLPWWVALRERPALMLGGQAEFFNSVQLAIGLGGRRSGH